MTLPTQRTATTLRSRSTAVPPEDLLWAPVSAFTLDALKKHAGQKIQTWSVARIVGSSYTLISADCGSTDLIGTNVAWEDSLCCQLQDDIGSNTIVVGDLRRHRGLRAAAQRYGIRAYAGAPLRAADGTRIGSLCGWSPAPVDDEDHLNALVSEQVRFMEQTLQRQLQHVDLMRRLDWSSQADADGAQCLLANAEEWLQLLAREEERGRALAEPAAVTVIDVTKATTGFGPGHSSVANRIDARAAKRVAQVPRDAVGPNAAAALTAPGRFAVLSDQAAGALTAQVPPTAMASASNRIIEALRVAAPNARIGRATRAGTAELLQVWADAEADLGIPAIADPPTRRDRSITSTGGTRIK